MSTPTPTPGPAPTPGPSMLDTLPTFGTPPPPSTPLPADWAQWLQSFQKIATFQDPPVLPPTTLPPPTFTLTLADLAAFEKANATAAPVDPAVSAADTAYLQIWGIAPPKGYIEGLVTQGMNVFEIVQHELSKPAASQTSYYRDQLATIASSIATAMGRR